MIEEIQSVFRDVFDDQDISLTRQTTAADIEQWDSLMHVTLMVHIEKHFGIRFSSSEIADLKNVGELEDLVSQHVAAQGRG